MMDSTCALQASGHCPEVSVIIPIYNSARYLKECLESVQTQSLRSLEILCVDDGSSDGSRKLVASVAEKDVRIRLICQNHAGSGAARNLGLNLACGRYVAFMDSDDCYADDRALSALVSAAESEDCAIALGSLRMFSGERRSPEWGDTFGPAERGLSGRARYLDYQSPFGYTCAVFERDFLLSRHLVFPQLTRFEDPVFFVRAMAEAVTFAVVTRVVYHYRNNHKKVDVEAEDFRLLREHLTGLRQLEAIAERYALKCLTEFVCYDTGAALKTRRMLAATEKEALGLLFELRKTAFFSAKFKRGLVRRAMLNESWWGRLYGRFCLRRMIRATVTI